MILWKTDRAVKQRLNGLNEMVARGEVLDRRVRSALHCFAETATQGTALFGGHLFPPLTHVFSLVRRQRTEPPACVTDGLALLGREILISLKPFAQMLLLIRRQLLPLLEALPGLGAFFGIHVGPLACAISQALLPLRGQLIPLLAEALQEFLLSLI
jgi:hypothetical protein